jgi:hypothetical protein
MIEKNKRPYTLNDFISHTRLTSLVDYYVHDASSLKKLTKLNMIRFNSGVDNL